MPCLISAWIRLFWVPRCGCGIICVFVAVCELDFVNLVVSMRNCCNCDQESREMVICVVI